MDPKLAEAIGLLRHQIISPVLMETGRAQLAYFRSLSEQDFDVPGKGARRFTPTTMKGWLYRYRKNGFPGITPKQRKDVGAFRVLRPEMCEQIEVLRRENVAQSCVKFYDRCIKEKVLGQPPICMETLRRFLKSRNLYQSRTITPRKRFEMSYFGELWTCDFMHGPQVLDQPGAKRRKKAILLAIIDDHSRLIVCARFGLFENTRLIEQVFKEAILAHGVPDRLYCDNGASFSSQYLSRVCAHLNIGLVHSKPYDSPSRGKIERFFRTVRSNFLDDIGEDRAWTIEDLNEGFSRWLREKYHHGHHRGIDARPIDRHQKSIRDYPRKRIAEESLDEFFLVTVSRVVAKDCTISLNGVTYEVPPQYIGKRVELKFSQESVSEIYLYDNGIRVSQVKPVDAFFNGRSEYTPSPRISDVALHEIELPGDKP
jgi:putative transposase